MPNTTPQDQTLDALTPGEALKLLHLLRDHLVDAISNAYVQHIEDAKRDLHQLAQRATEDERQALYASARDLLDHGALALLNRFRDTYRADYDRALAALSRPDEDSLGHHDELALVDAQAFERDLAVARLSAKAQYACSQQLTALDRRVAALLRLKRLDGDSNPLGVKRLFTALVDAAEAGWAGAQRALVLLETFAHYTAAKLPEIYRALNQTLVERGVLPKLPIEIDASEPDLPSREPAAKSAGDIFARLAGGAGLGAAADALGESGDGRLAPLVLGRLIDGLTALQQGKQGAAEQLGVDLHAIDVGTSAPLRRLAESRQLQGLRGSETVTIELVANLFDAMFSDAEVPRKLRAEIGKLQVPVLKIALTNRAFFSDGHHPARRLIDVIAAAVRGWDRGDEPALFSRIDEAVQQVLDGFDTDTAVFKRQVDAIEAMLEEAEEAARGQVSELVQRLEQRDRTQVVEAVVKDRIGRCTADANLPPAVASFIDEHWRDLLGRIYVKYGDKGADWRDALATLEDLVWSVQPKLAMEERVRLMQMLPALLERLPAGLARLGRKQAWQPFLADLMPLHMEAIKQTTPDGAAGRSGDHAGSGDNPVRTSVRGPATFAVDTGDGGPEQAELGESDQAEPRISETDSVPSPDAGYDIGTDAAREGGVSPASEAAPEPVDPDVAAAQQVEVGDWLEVHTLSGGNLSLRANWRSHQSGLILFADRRGGNAQVLSIDRLATALRQGSARLLSREPLTDRAVARLLDRAESKEPAVACPET